MDKLHPSEEIARYVSTHYLVFSDPRFSLTFENSVSDVLQLETGNEGADVSKRLLVVGGDQRQKFYDFCANIQELGGKNYIVPSLIESDSETDVDVYEIPVSSSLFMNDQVEEGTNLSAAFDNNRLAESVASLVGEYYRSTGNLISAESLVQRLVLVDFIEESIEPITLIPPVALDDSLFGIDSLENLKLFGTDDEANQVYRKKITDLINHGTTS